MVFEFEFIEFILMLGEVLCLMFGIVVLDLKFGFVSLGLYIEFVGVSLFLG